MKKHFVIFILLLFPLYMFGQSHNCVTANDYGNNKEEVKYANINGINVYYETYGDSSKQPLLLIDGNGGSVKSGRCQIEYFKDAYFVVVADSRYQGKSENGRSRFSIKLVNGKKRELTELKTQAEFNELKKMFADIGIA